MESTCSARCLCGDLPAEDAKMVSLNNAEINQKHRIININVDDSEIIDFLFTLGCYEGEYITVISKQRDNLVVCVKDARYSIDSELAEVIIV